MSNKKKNEDYIHAKFLWLWERKSIFSRKERIKDKEGFIKGQEKQRDARDLLDINNGLRIFIIHFNLFIWAFTKLNKLGNRQRQQQQTTTWRKY